MCACNVTLFSLFHEKEYRGNRGVGQIFPRALTVLQINPNQQKDKFEIEIVIILRSGKDLLTTRPVHKYCYNSNLTVWKRTSKSHEKKLFLTCSWTSTWGDSSSLMKTGTDPAWTTHCVCGDVPDAMFVSAQAASNYK